MKVRSGEEALPCMGRLVWEGPLMHINCPTSSALQIASLLLAAAVSCVWECHFGSRALKSPTIRMSLVMLKSQFRSRVCPGTDKAGGMILGHLGNIFAQGIYM